MRELFADAFYYLALANPSDAAHAAARRARPRDPVRLLTHTSVLAEVMDGLCRAATRALALSLIDALARDPLVEVIHVDEGLWEKGVALYRGRADKDWSLTDCISFAVMNDRGIAEALTGDRHFEQAGYRALLAAKS